MAVCNSLRDVLCSAQCNAPQARKPGIVQVLTCHHLPIYVNVPSNTLHCSCIGCVAILILIIHSTHALDASGRIHAFCLSENLGYSSKGVGGSNLQGAEIYKFLQLRRSYAAVGW